ncbi:MAG TPA: MFS transporter [Terracidiphilus sp.]|jgi:MFS family permease|nr:MFS transporter [Terracidiphilus sp.]
MDSTPADHATHDPLSGAVARGMRRLGPILMVLYVVSFLDRANIGFAKQALEISQGISEKSYALGAGLFFIGYSSCGFPSNLILHKIGARVWLGVLMISWGLLSAATMFVNGSTSFYVLRLLLGVTEAGFFPGVILYLTYWFPGRVRGQILGLFYLGVPLALIVGGPLSGLLLDLNRRGGLEGWQWMFLVEGLLAVAFGFLAFWFLESKPAHASWLPPGEKEALVEAIAEEAHARRATGPANISLMLRDPRVLRFLLIYALIQISTYGAVFYLPAEIAALLHKPAGFEVGLVSAIPWLCALAAVYFLPRAADARRNHRGMAALTLLIAGIASFAFPIAGPVAGLIALSVAVSGFIAVQPLFWTFPTGYLADRAAAGGIALIGVGNLGGFFAPNLKVWADQSFHSSSAGLYLLAGVTVLNAGLISTIRSGRGTGAH